MDLKLHLLESFPARGSDGKDYKVCAYERMRRDDTVHDGQEHWLPTGVTEFRLDSGEQIEAHTDGSMKLLQSDVALKKSQHGHGA
jgi:hypothetical protein